MSELSVWRERARRAEKQVDLLLATVDRLTTPPAPLEHKKPRTLPDPEQTAVDRAEAPMIKRAEKIFIDNTVKALMDKGYSRAAAEKEAKRLRREITDMQPESS